MRFHLIATLRCALGRHSGGNFCTHCGTALVSQPFFPFSVTDPATGAVTTVYGLNIYHIRTLLNDSDRTCEIQRLPLL